MDRIKSNKDKTVTHPRRPIKSCNTNSFMGVYQGAIKNQHETVRPTHPRRISISIRLAVDVCQYLSFVHRFKHLDHPCLSIISGAMSGIGTDVAVLCMMSHSYGLQNCSYESKSKEKMYIFALPQNIFNWTSSVYLKVYQEEQPVSFQTRCTIVKTRGHGNP